MVHHTILLQLFLVLLVLLFSANCSCCCNSCDCYGGGCCCCGTNRNDGNNAAATVAEFAIGSAMLANTAQAAAVAPPIHIFDRKTQMALGPELFPDGSTGRLIEQQQLLDGIERAAGGGNGGGVFFPGAGRRRRRAPGVGKLDGMENQFNFATMFPGMGGGGGGMNKQNPFGNDPPGLGPGLLPDGSTGRRKSQHGGGFNDFFDGMNFDGMHSPAEQRRQKRYQKMGKRNCENCVKKKCPCQQQLKPKSDKCNCPASKLKMIGIDPNFFRNFTAASLFLGLVPKAAFAEPNNWSTDKPSPNNWSTDNPSPDNWSTDNPSLSAEIDAFASSPSSVSSDSSREFSSTQHQQRFRSSASSSAEIVNRQQNQEDLIARRLFLIPPVGPVNGRTQREATSSAEKSAVVVAPSLSLHFYKAIEPNPENADERVGADDYD